MLIPSWNLDWLTTWYPYIIYLILTATFWSRCYYLHSTNRRTEVQRCLPKLTQLRFRFKYFELRANFLIQWTTLPSEQIFIFLFLNLNVGFPKQLLRQWWCEVQFSHDERPIFLFLVWPGRWKGQIAFFIVKLTTLLIFFKLFQERCRTPIFYLR